MLYILIGVLSFAGAIAGMWYFGKLYGYLFMSKGKTIDQIAEKYHGSDYQKDYLLKKYPDAEVGSHKTILIAVGLLLGFGTSIYAFTKESKPAEVVAFQMEEIPDDFEIAPPATEQLKPPPPPPPPPPPQLEVVDDEEILDDEPEIANTEVEADEEITVPEPPPPPKKPKVVEPEIFTIVEEMPRFKGCEKVPNAEVQNCTNQAVYQYIGKNVVYPPMAVENDITGKVFVSFVVDENGDVTNVEVKKGVDKLLDEAAVKVVKGLPKFIPGKQRGKPAKVSFIIPVNFQLQ